MSCLYGSVFIKKKDYMSKFRLFIIFILYDRPLIIICLLTCIIVGTRVRNNKVNFAMISNFFIDWCLTSSEQYFGYIHDKKKFNTTGATSGARTAYPSGAPEFTQVSTGVRVTRSLVLCACFVDRCLSFFPFSFCNCVVCSSSIYGFWLPFWYLQALLKTINIISGQLRFSFDSRLLPTTSVVKWLACSTRVW
jgi:hypothetical protein